MKKLWNKKITTQFLVVLTLLLLIDDNRLNRVQAAEKAKASGVEDTKNWNKKFAGDGNWDELHSIAIDSNGNVYVVGYVSSAITYNDWGERHDRYYWSIKKFDSNGVEDTENWDKKIDDILDGIYSYSIAIDSNDNVYVAANVYAAGFNWWIKKFDANGVEDTDNWNKKIDGNGGDDYAYSIAIDSNDNVYVAGAGSNIAGDGDGKDGWIKKFNSDGVEDTDNWDKKFDGSDKYTGGVTSIAIDPNNNVYVVGSSDILVGESYQIGDWIKKFNSDGIEDTKNWNKKISRAFSGNIIAIDTSSNIYVADSGKIKKFNSNGVEYTKNWNGKLSSHANSITVDSKGNVYVAGVGKNLVSRYSNEDWWVTKFNSYGIEDTKNWNKKFSSTNDEFSQEGARSIAIDSNGNVYVVGVGKNLVRASSGLDWWIKKFSP